jgi:CPA1 family monovalent cation:H+ antiporter
MVCLLFGALIAPTDPISAMENLKESDLPKMLQNKIAGESLFNDGVGVVVFIMMTNVVYHGESLYWGKALLDIVWAIGIGSLIGVSMGWMVTRLLRDIEEPAIEMILTLAVATGSYALAEHLNASAPMATVWAGLIIGNMGKTSVLSSTAQRRVHLFWNMLDDLLTTILFVLMGFVLLILKVDIRVSLIAVAAIPVVLIARWFSVWIPISILRKFYPMSRKSVRILTWAGLRGGISLALALSLPEGTTRDLLLVCAWAVVVFSILVQGTTLKRMVESNITVFKEV